MLIDIIVVGLLLFFVVAGYLQGFLRCTLSMVKISISIIVAVLLCRPAAIMLDTLFGYYSWFDSDLVATAVMALAIFIIIRLALMKIRRIVEKFRENDTVSRVDNIFGALFGLLRFAFVFFIFSLVVLIVSIIPFLDSTVAWLFEGSTIAYWLYSLMAGDILRIIADAVGAN